MRCLASFVRDAREFCRALHQRNRGDDVGDKEQRKGDERYMVHGEGIVGAVEGGAAEPEPRTVRYARRANGKARTTARRVAAASTFRPRRAKSVTNPPNMRVPVVAITQAKAKWSVPNTRRAATKASVTRTKRETELIQLPRRARAALACVRIDVALRRPVVVAGAIGR